MKTTEIEQLSPVSIAAYLAANGWQLEQSFATDASLIAATWTKGRDFEIAEWKRQLLERAADVFGGADPPKPVDLQPLHAKNGQLTLENDFLERALTWCASNGLPRTNTAHRMRAFLFASATTAFCHSDFSLSWYAHLEIGSSCRCAFITAEDGHPHAQLPEPPSRAR